MAKAVKKAAPKKAKAKVPAKAPKVEKAKTAPKKPALMTAKNAPKSKAPTPPPAKDSKKTAAPVTSRPAVVSAIPGRLGTKRECLKCRAKFYDFEKNPIECPKCHSTFDPEEFQTKIVLKSEPAKKPVKAAEPDTDEEGSSTNEDIVVISTSEDFESVEDLGEEENIVGRLTVDGEENDDEY